VIRGNDRMRQSTVFILWEADARVRPRSRQGTDDGQLGQFIATLALFSRSLRDLLKRDTHRDTH